MNADGERCLSASSVLGYSFHPPELVHELNPTVIEWRSILTDRERLDSFRLRFGISGGAVFGRFKIRVGHAATESFSSLISTDDRRVLETEFAFRNGSRFVTGQTYGTGLHIIHGIEKELSESESFAALTERIQQLLWAFEALGYFKESQYGPKAGRVFAGYLIDAIELSPGVDLRLQMPPGKVELVPAGVSLLDDVVDRATQWLARYPDVQNEFRQTLSILAGKDVGKFRQAQDSLRFALEKLLKLLVGNNVPVEAQGKPLKAWLTEKGVHEDLRNVAVSIMGFITTQYQNAAVKHDSTIAGGEAKSWSVFEVEYMVYQYATLIRLLIEASSTGSTPSTNTPTQSSTP